MQNKRCEVILILVGLLSITVNAFAALPTQEQLDKFCIQAEMKIDDQVHSFYIKSIADFTDDGFVVRWGKYGENRTYYLKEQFLNYNEMKEKYLRLKKEFNL